MAKAFYKYVNADVLQLILENKTVRFTNPLEFNDPFDCNYPGYSEKPAAINNYITAFCKKRGLSPNRRNEVQQEINQLSKLITLELGNLLEELRSDWEKLLSQFKILCLTNTDSNILMWSHYADDHKGAVICFAPSAFNDLPPPQEVKYEKNSRRLNVVFDGLMKKMVEESYAEHFLGKKPTTSSTVATQKTLQALFDFLFIKREEWSYENEHRIIVPSASLNSEFVSFNPDGLKQIIFGLKMDPLKKEKISNDLKRKYPNIEILEASKKNGDLFIEKKPIPRAPNRVAGSL